MIIAYHAIFTTYGTWLPNDPRGSYSKTIYNAELAALGSDPLRPAEPTARSAIHAAISRGGDAAAVAAAVLSYERHPPRRCRRLCQSCRAAGLNVPACAIMNDHVHFLVWRSKHTIEYVVNQLKGGGNVGTGTRSDPVDKELLEGVYQR